jgi:hypothetical protein
MNDVVRVTREFYGPQLIVHFVGSFNEPLPEREAVHAAIGAELLARLDRLGLAVSWSQSSG